MDQRIKVGILFSVSEGWIGGSYYFLNIVAALNLLKEDEKPHIIIYSNNDESFKLVKRETNYAYLSYECSTFSYSMPERLINKIGRALLNKNFIQKGLPKDKMPLLFGYYEQLTIHKCNKKIYWIPDFQEYYYPQFIGEEVKNSRQIVHKFLIKKKASFIFSSQDALNDFNKIYPGNDCVSTVVRFAVTHPDYSNVSIADLRQKYKLDDTYFFTPNQFWPHKNHITLLKAAKKLKDQNINVRLVFSGKFNEADAHVKFIQQYIADNDLTNNISFLGFIDRKEQLCIMKHSLAVVQPSLFEGWSTVVEDAKAMGKFLILSDLKVHKEQTDNSNCILFNAEDDSSLAEALINTLDNRPIDQNYNYTQNIKLFAEGFIKAINR